MKTSKLTIGFVVALFTIVMASQSQVDAASPGHKSATNIVETLRAAAASGDLAYRLTTPDEFKALAGVPLKQQTQKDGDSNVLILEYPQSHAVFTHIGETFPYT